MSDEKKSVSFVVTYTNDIGGVDTPLEAAKECLDGILNQGARVFEVKNNTTGETVTVDLDEEDEDAVLPSEPSEQEKNYNEMVLLLRRVVGDLLSMELDELSKFEKQLLRDSKKILGKL